MGVYLSLARPPLELAVDALSQRASLMDLRAYLEFGPAPETGDSEAGRAWSAHVEASHRYLHLWRGFGPLLDVLRGCAHNPTWWTSLFITEEFPEPEAWAVYGARKPGWKAPDFPLRYSLPSDVLHIRAALGNLSEDVVEARIAAVVAGRPDEDADVLRRMMAEWLPQLRRFYDAAAESGEIVLYLLG